MFETLDDGGLIATIEEATRAEAAAAALRSAAIAELAVRRINDDDPRALWACDSWDSAAAEVAAAMNISHGKACGQIRIAEALRDRLPAVAGLYRQGLVSARIIAVLTWRTRLITDDQVWVSLDAALAARVEQWGPLSDDKLLAAIDALVYRFDREAVVASRAAARTRDFTVGHYQDEAGLSSIWGKLLAPDAEVLARKVAAMSATVCDADPRTAGERRADALGALANGNDHLPCACGSPQCPAADQAAPKSSVLVNVLVDQAAVDAARAQRPQDAGTAVMSGAEILPTPMLAALLRNGAQLQPLCVRDEQDTEPETGYRPSAKLARLVRARDLTCRFPGCTMPAEFCDIDHVVPYPIGPTHASNLACLCRKHHHLKTFWVGDWSLTLLADGTAIWTSPTGHTYTTYPGCRSLFPEWDTTVAPPQQRRTSTPPTDADRGMKMPTRKQTRAAARSARIKAERAQNNSDPPPF